MLRLAFLLALAPAGALAASPQALLYERTLMSRADARCGLFEPGVGRALKAAAVQARGAALRGGGEAAALKAVEGRAAARAAATPCASPELKVAAGRVRAAFDGYARMTRMNVQGWGAAERTVLPGRWRLKQAAGSGADPAVLGLEGPGNRLALAARFADGRSPAAVRLRFRDAARDPHFGGAGAPAAGSSRTVLAASAEPAPPGLAPGGVKGARLYRWPAATAGALVALDPREQVAVEFVDRRGAVRTVLFDVGDFAAGLAFLEAGV